MDQALIVKKNGKEDRLVTLIALEKGEGIMLTLYIVASVLTAATSVSIVEPVDGETYDGDWLPLRVLVENGNVVPDSVQYSLNGSTVVQVPRLNTDWYTYMRENNRNGSTESPAPLTPTVLWTAHVSGTYHEFVSPIVVDGRLYHASEEQETAFCLNAATGEILWSFPGLGDPIDDALAYDNGYVYVASDSVWCLDAITGERQWAYLGHADHEMAGPPAILDGVLYAQEWKPNTCFITALNSVTGDFIWETFLPKRTPCSPAVTDELVLVPTRNGPLYALSRSTGAIVWENTDSEGGFWDTSPCLVDNTVFIGGNDQCVHSIRLTDGELNWETEIGGMVESTPCYADGFLHVGVASPESEKKIACLDAEDGSLVWQSEGGLHASMGWASGYCYWGDVWDGTINCTDAATGELVWSYPTTSGINGIVSSPAIVDGVMYIAATDSSLYAFGTGFKYTYKDDYFYGDLGSNELIVTSWDDGIEVAADTITFTITQTGITLEPSTVLELYANPNPFQTGTSITFTIEEPAVVSLRIFDLTGREVLSLVNQEMTNGNNSFLWDGRREDGQQVSSGLYICCVEHEGIVETIGLCVLR